VERWIRRSVTLFVGSEHRIAAWGLVVAAVTALLAFITFAVSVWGPGDGGSPAQPVTVSGSATPSPDEPDLYVSSRPVPDDHLCLAFPGPASLAVRAELAAGTALSEAGDQGGVSVGHLRVDIALQGGAHALTIESIDIVPRTPRPSRPLNGALVCAQGQGDVPKVRLAANMDTSAPFLYDERTPTRRHFGDNVITLKPQEQVSIEASFQSKLGYREFQLIVQYVLDGKSHSLKIPQPSGAVYAVTAPSDSYGVAYLESPTGSYQMNSQQLCEYAGTRKGC
jgi:hypothetical protein